MFSFFVEGTWSSSLLGLGLSVGSPIIEFLDSVGEELPCLACVALTGDEKVAAFWRFSLPGLFYLGRRIGSCFCGWPLELRVCFVKELASSDILRGLSDVSVLLFSGPEVWWFGVVCSGLCCDLFFRVFSMALYGLSMTEPVVTA